MISIEGDSKNKLYYKKLKNIKANTSISLRSAFFESGKDLKQESTRLINDPPKTGRIYLKRLNGKLVEHQASAPGQPPANFTGDLKNLLDFNVSGNGSQLEYGDKAVYARYLEEGTSKMEERPFLKTAIENKDGLIFNNFKHEIEKKLS